TPGTCRRDRRSGSGGAGRAPRSPSRRRRSQRSRFSSCHSPSFTLVFGTPVALVSEVTLAEGDGDPLSPGATLAGASHLDPRDERSGRRLRRRRDGRVVPSLHRGVSAAVFPSLDAVDLNVEDAVPTVFIQFRE